MKKKLLITIILSINAYCSYAQNLVANPSFENYTDCPTNLGQTNKAISWIDPSGSSDYFNSCTSNSNVSTPLNIAGYQYPRTGNAYMGFAAFCVPSEREYIQGILIDSLTAGVVYRSSFYISPADNLKYSSDGVGIHFSKIAITGSSGSILSYTPQINNIAGNIIMDTVGWTLVEGTFTAVGGEKYLTIGNFNTDTNTQYAVINSSSIYTCAYFYIDDISVYPDSETVVNELGKEGELKIYPNPTDKELKIDNGELKIEEVRVYNVLGSCVLYQQLTTNNQQLTLNVSGLRAGIYFVQVKTKDKMFNKKIIINH